MRFFLESLLLDLADVFKATTLNLVEVFKVITCFMCEYTVISFMLLVWGLVAIIVTGCL